jgi:hypothetical protein
MLNRRTRQPSRFRQGADGILFAFLNTETSKMERRYVTNSNRR